MDERESIEVGIEKYHYSDGLDHDVLVVVTSQ